MGLIYVPSRRIRARFKPDFHYRINPELNNGLDFLLDFSSAGAVLNKGNFDPGRSITPVNNAISVGLGGKGSKCSSTTRSYLESNCPTLPTSDGSGGGDYSILVVLDHPSAASRQFAYHSRKNSGGFNSSFAIANGYYASGGSTGLNESGALWLGDYDGVTGNAQGVKASGVLDGGVHCALLTKRVLSGTNYWNLYIDGVLAGSSNYTGSRTVYDASQLLSINGFATADSLVPGGRTYLVATFKNALDSIAPDLSAAPYKTLLESVRRRIWVPVSAGGGPTYTLAAGIGSFTTTVVAAGLKASRNIAAGTGYFTTTGVSAGLIAARKIVAGVGSFSTTGYDAGLVYTPVGGPTYTISAGIGAFTTTGISAGLVAARKLPAAAGAFTTTCYDAILTKAYVLTAGVGSFTTTGVAASLIANRVLTAGTGAFTTTGYPANLTTATAPSLSAADLEAIWDVELETGYTARQMMRIMFAALAGKRSGLGTSTESYYDVATGTTVRISLTPDANGNGTPVVDGT